MVDIMIFPKKLCKIVGRPEGVQNVMDHIITEITYYKSAKKYKSVTPEEQVKDEEENTGNQNTRYRGHYKPIFIFRVFMMNAMHKKMKSLSPG